MKRSETGQHSIPPTAASLRPRSATAAETKGSRLRSWRARGSQRAARRSPRSRVTRLAAALALLTAPLFVPQPALAAWTCPVFLCLSHPAGPYVIPGCDTYMDAVKKYLEPPGVNRIPVCPSLPSAYVLVLRTGGISDNVISMQAFWVGPDGDLAKGPVVPFF